MTIFVMCPDASAPIGGVKVLYGFVRALSSTGNDAKLWTSRKTGRWAAHLHASEVNSDTLNLEAGDILIVPEVYGRRYGTLNRDAQVVIFNQNQYYTLDGGATESTVVDGAYPHWRKAQAVITTSRSVSEFLREIEITIPLHELQVYLSEGAVQAPGFSSRKSTLAYMPRKRAFDLDSLIGAARRHPEFESWEFRRIDGLSPSEVAETLRNSAIFLHGGEREGFGLPALEAMDAGAYVVGWTGDGGREFMQPQYCTILPDNDLTAAARTLKTILRQAQTHPQELHEKTVAARHYVRSTYAWESFVQRSHEIAQDLLSGEAAQVRPRTVRHMSAYARRQSRLNLKQRLGSLKRVIQL